MYSVWSTSAIVFKTVLKFSFKLNTTESKPLLILSMSDFNTEIFLMISFFLESSERIASNLSVMSVSVSF